MLASKDSGLVLIYHPELCFFSQQLNEYYYLSFFTNYFFSLYETSGSETFFTPIILIPQLILVLFLGVLFINFFFSYFTHPNKEGLMIDADYLTSNSSAEAEKEITSYDDIILGLVILIYIFG